MDIVEEVLSHEFVADRLASAFPPHKDDLDRLVGLLDLVRPTAILELGSGWSTLVMARWLMDNPGSFMETLENDPVYYHGTITALGAVKDIVERFVNGNNKTKQVRTSEWEPNERWRVLISPIVNGQLPDGVLYGYQCLTEPDFVYVDGPALWGKRMITENAITHVNSARPMVFYVDGRVGCAARIYHSYRLGLKQPYEWLYCSAASCSLVYHETFAAAGEWFEANHPCERAKES